MASPFFKEMPVREITLMHELMRADVAARISLSPFI